MKHKMQDISYLEDSRQLMESEPSNIIRKFIGLVIIVMITLIIWSCLNWKQTVVVARGRVIGNNQHQSLMFSQAGVLQEIAVEDGDYVTKGDLLYRLRNEALLAEKETLDNEIEKEKIKIMLTQKVIDSVIIGKNLLAEEGQEKQYYQIYENYLMVNSPTELGENGVKQSIRNIGNQLLDLEEVWTDIFLNKETMNFDNKYYAIFQEYQLDVAKAESKTTAAIKIKGIKNELEDELLKQTSSLNDLSFNENLRIRQKQSEIILMLEQQIAEGNIKIIEMNPILEQKNKKLQKLEVRAQKDGRIDVMHTFTIGMIIPEGMHALDIINREEGLKIEILISDTDIGMLKGNEKLKYRISGHSDQEVGTLSGNLEKISLNSKKSVELGGYYYVAVGSIEQLKGVKQNSEDNKLRLGMLSEVSIITGDQRIIHYLLDKFK
ncbi:MAG: biotin/lipoyl-binding protein [Culicoidibacterales bacterium]